LPAVFSCTGGRDQHFVQVLEGIEARERALFEHAGGRLADLGVHPLKEADGPERL
jgi:hypothetical protein